MLVLTRGLKQQIIIGEQKIIVTILEINGGRVRLGIEAPQDVTIRRDALLTNERSCNQEEQSCKMVPEA
ncbi:MAG: carbon storage regulator [Planctomycetales bacterium]|jgi:carbon storage regulator|nr:carbon storage regulator [Planctomycetales bacterium]